MIPLTVLYACVCIATGVNLCCHLAPLCPHPITAGGVCILARLKDIQEMAER